MVAAPNNVLLTGTGRSGTTLTCHLLNRLDDTVALFEPMRVKGFPELGGHAEIAGSIESFCEEQRTSIHERGRAISKNVGGVMPDNPYGSATTGAGLRAKSVSKGEIAIDKDLRPGFMLVVKHISAFTAMLEELVGRFPVFAVVRNPLPVLASWNSIDFNLRDGHIPAAERIDPELRTRLEAIDDPLDRQIHILAWFHGKFHRHLPDQSIIRYESLVASGGRALSVINPGADALAEPLESRNRSALYPEESMQRIGERLLRSEGAHWESYTRESVERLLETPASSAG